MKRLFIIATTFLMGILAMSSCVKEYTIKVGTNNVEWGTATGSGTYAAKSQVEITAIPASGCYFIKWDDGNTDNPRTITVTEDKTYTAIFSNDPNGGGQGGGNGTSHISGNIDENATWPDLGFDVDYIVEGRIYIEGNALLTIEPGVTIMFTGTDGGMTVGENAGLRMVGTASKPIKFVGPTNNVNNGSWNNINLLSKRNDNVWEYVEFIRGGSDEYMWSAVVDIDNAKVSMKHCTIDGSLGTGIDLEWGANFIAFEDKTIKNCAEYPIALGKENIYTLNKNNTFSNNGKNYIYVSDDYFDLNENVTLVNMPLPYFFNAGLNLPNPHKFTIEAGTELVFGSETEFIVSEDATLIANGTSSAPIVFRGMENEIGYWKGIRYYSQKEASKMNYCKVGNCGGNEAGFYSACLSFWNNSRLTLTNCTFGNSRHYGIALDDIENMNRITHENNTFVSCEAGNVFIESGGEYNGTEYDDGQVLPELPR